MSRLQLLWLHLTVALTAITGVVFAVMKYFLKTDDEFSVVNHPLQPHMLAVHVVVAPFALLILGWVFSNHMLPKYRFGDRDKHRGTGLAAMALIVPMTLSAYLLQVSTNETLREVMAWAHWITSGVFLLAFLIHAIIGRSKAAAG
ncbi:MAG TPA: hypothetical protein VNI54_14870 [Thermoanaerobaculia bacterium]|nr:hypothetical protein [Thermoanaerobaculia bacterium]